MRKKLCNLVIVFIMFSTLLHFAKITNAEEYVPASHFIRLSGDTRLETAISISQLGWPEGLVNVEKAVIIARADNPADALSSASLSGVKDAPILLSYTKSIDSKVLDEIKRLGAQKVYVLGGTGAISDNVVNSIKSIVNNVQRLNGVDRYETAKKVNEAAGLSTSKKAIIVNGTRVADALSSATESSIGKIPVYLSTGSKLPVPLPSSVKEVTIYGGTGVVSKSLQDALVSRGITVKRIAGATRYLTNLNTIKDSQIDSEHYIFVRGNSVKSTMEDYPDAVAASGLAQRLGAKVVLLDSNYVDPAVENYLKENPLPGIVLGGQSTLSDYRIIQCGYTTPQNFKINSTLLNVTNGGGTLSTLVKVGDTLETVLSTFGVPVFSYEDDMITEFIYPDNTVLIDNTTRRVVSIEQVVIDDITIGEVINSIGEPDEIGFDEERQESYTFYTTGLKGEYGLFFYLEEDENGDTWVSSVEITLMGE